MSGGVPIYPSSRVARLPFADMTMQDIAKQLDYEESFDRGCMVFVVLLNIVTLVNVLGWYV